MLSYLILPDFIKSDQIFWHFVLKSAILRHILVKVTAAIKIQHQCNSKKVKREVMCTHT